MPPKRKAAAKKADKPEHEVKKARLTKALKKVADNELPDEIAPDAEFPDKSLTVFIDHDEGVAYDVMLNQTNIGGNNNKYYVIQVLCNKNDPDGFYTIWTRWGRVGYSGQTSRETVTQKAAIDAFKKKFKDKTGNSFDDRDSFVLKNKKYDWIKIDHSKKESKSGTIVEVKISDVDEVPSKLHPAVKAAVDMMCDMSAIERYLKNQMNYDADKAPLGRITKAQVKSGFVVLSGIEKKILANDFDEEHERLVNEYYTKIPHNFGFQRPKMIRTMDELKEELALLEALSDVEVINSTSDKKKSKQMHPSDRNYERLNCELKPIDKKSPTYKMIDDYMKNTQGKTHGYSMKLHNVFEINRSGESSGYSTYSKDIHNRCLLWHGSGLANWFGILSQGLRIAPPEAPVSGYMFGKGVYFADCCSKSAGYCRAYNKQRCFMTLAEVALGNCRKLKDSDYNASNLPSGFHSTHGMGRYYPDEKQKHKIKLEKNDVVVPMGKIVEKSDSDGCCLFYNEFIVYNTSQIRLRYLLEVEF